VRQELPAGTVTFLFTDVEGSTRLLHELGAESYAQALAQHRRLLREAFASHGGVEVDTQGDAFFYVFPTAPGALQAAAQGQQVLSSGPIIVRMGLHTGTPHLTDEGYVGDDVHRAARIAAAAHGGQVVVSASTAALVGRDGLRDLGEHRLKDLSALERIYQLGHDAFPPLTSLNQTNLPLPATPFLGRAEEVVAVVDLLRSEGVRLLTLTGVGGTGKTRLAIEAASELAPEYEHGVWWVPLAPLREPSLVLESAARALGTSEELGEYVGDRRLLFVFDNFEHLLEAVPPLGDLLARCPNAKALVTSRQPLHLSAERQYAVPTLAEAEAIDLFYARSVESGPADVVAAICRRLDCLPLAVELAAARTKVLSPAAILERLERSLPLLMGGPRDAPERQQTLRATIAWSHDLLSADEQRLFAGLSVFAGGCTMEAAETVCGADLDVLESLVDKSLVRRSGDRFWMLETIREFAQERLNETGDDEDFRGRHTAYFLELGELAKPELRNRSSSNWLDRLQAEHDNIRAVLGEALEHGRPDVALRLGGAVWLFWQTRGYWTEGRRWLESALAASADGDRDLRIGGLWGAGLLAVWQGDLERGRSAADELLALAAETDSSGARAIAVHIAGIVASHRGDWDLSAQLNTEAAQLARELGDSWMLSVAVNNLGDIAVNRGDYERALELFEESLAIGRERQDQDRLARAFLNLGLTTLMLGDVQRARSLLRDGLIAAREIGLVEGFMMGFVCLGAAYAGEDPARAARFMGRADVLLEEAASALPQVEGRLRQETEAKLRAKLGEDAFTSVYQEGRALALEDALTLAFQPDDVESHVAASDSRGG
jgi:predicted ATPase/class 3 adenylate cyclase